MKHIAKIEPGEIEVSEVLLRLADQAELRNVGLTKRLMSKLRLQKDAASRDELMWRFGTEDMQ